MTTPAGSGWRTGRSRSTPATRRASPTTSRRSAWSTAPRAATTEQRYGAGSSLPAPLLVVLVGHEAGDQRGHEGEHAADDERGELGRQPGEQGDDAEQRGHGQDDGE